MTSPAPLCIALAAVVALGGCSASKLTPPSLAPRAAEAIDPRVPVEHAIVQRPIRAGVGARLAALLGEARSGDAAFRAALGPAQRAVSGAGAARSEGWIVAQEAVSATEAARAPTSRALSEIDAIAGEAVAQKGAIGASELAAVQAAADEVGAIDRAQRTAIGELSARLSR
ncbi:MAG: hypothetical protein ABIQ98_04420 [Sphingomicrobium sp.]